MTTHRSRSIALAIAVLLPATGSAQTFPTGDPVIKRIWEEGMTDRSQVASLME